MNKLPCLPHSSLSRLLALALLLSASVIPNTFRSQSKTQVRVPDPDNGVDALGARKANQLAKAAAQFKVFYKFRFVDAVKESGITFVHHIEEDAGYHYKPVHYDHGNGLAAADVDGDGLYDLYFVNQVGGNELWKNAGKGKFKNITAEAGVGVTQRISVTASFADIDNDGDQDLFVTTVRGGNLLFRNDGKGHFQDISHQAGVDLVAHSSGAVFFDYDRDGLLDLLVCNVGKYTNDEKWPSGAYKGLEDAFFGHMFPDRFEYPVLYRNMGNCRFKDVTAQVGPQLQSWSGDASFADLNEDGWPDLFILNMQGHDHYFQNDMGKAFLDKTADYFPRTPYGTMGIKFFDYDNDGRMDLLLTDMHSDMMGSRKPDEEKQKTPLKHQMSEDHLGAPADTYVFGSAFYHNLGAGKFQEISDQLGVDNYWPWGVSVGDVNADGWDDAFISSSMNFPFRYGINAMLLNNRGERFLDAEFLLGIEPRRGGRTHTPWFNLDCAGEGRGMKPCKGKSGEITVMATLGSRSSVMFDLDDDGDLDLVTNDFNSEPQVFVSDLAQHRGIAWLKVLPIGTVSNRNGLGAIVRIRSGKHVYTKQYDGKSGYLSQSVLPLYFGLGDSRTVDEFEIQWPSGKKQVVSPPPHPNQTFQVTEPR